ncbi:hypothetical protein FKP32DRAFT_920261 [Trametes sanguinea]|nr:hypothetical protein FKP32DRAFT_920261 [Trametes sanguinea]
MPFGRFPYPKRRLLRPGWLQIAAEVPGCVLFDRPAWVDEMLRTRPNRLPCRDLGGFVRRRWSNNGRQPRVPLERSARVPWFVQGTTIALCEAHAHAEASQASISRIACVRLHHSDGRRCSGAERSLLMRRLCGEPVALTFPANRAHHEGGRLNMAALPRRSTPRPGTTECMRLGL